MKLALAGVVLALASSAAFAETIDVNAFDDRPDASPGDGVCDADLDTPGLQCTLRAAIQHANATPGEDTIVLPAGTYRLTIKGTEENASATGDLDVNDDLQIQGAGAETTILDAAKLKDRVLDLGSGIDVTIAGLTIRGGKAPRGESGGGVRSDGATLVVDSCVIAGCKASDDAGGVDLQGGGTVIRNTWITKCTTGDDGGGLDIDNGTLLLDRTTISGCKSLKSEGGGLENSGATVTMTNCTLSGNKARKSGGAVSLEDGGTLDLDGCTIAFNKAKTVGGISVTDEEFGANTCRVHGSIVAKNKKQNGDRALISLGGNVEDGTVLGFETSSTDPALAPLAANNIGVQSSPPTHAIATSSPAAAAVTSGCLATDERGVPRGAAPCSAGAHEAQ